MSDTIEEQIEKNMAKLKAKFKTKAHVKRMANFDINKFSLVRFSPSERYRELFEHEETLDDKAFWIELGMLLTSNDDLYDNRDWIEHFLQHSDNKKQFIMSDYERRAFKKLPAILTIYRGCNESSLLGYSWTLSKKVAKFFATTDIVHRCESKAHGIILTATCKKSEVIALFTEREEREIFIRPANVRIIQKENLQTWKTQATNKRQP